MLPAAGAGRPGGGGGARHALRVLQHLILTTVLVRAHEELRHGLYNIRNLLGCPLGDWCHGDLSWDRMPQNPWVTVELNDPLTWEIIPHGYHKYSILNKGGCPDDKWCNGILSWDDASPHPMAMIKFNDTTLWELTPRGGGWRIASSSGCPNALWCGAELSWDVGSWTHPSASVRFSKPVSWEIIPLMGAAWEWTEWSSCNQSCGGGIRSRSQVCVSYDPLEPTPACTTTRLGEQGDLCNKQPCPGLPHGLYAIRNLLNCPHDDWCGAELSIDGAAPRPYATVEWTDPVDWELIPQGEDLYYIRTTWGCPAGKWCHAYLSWDPTGTHPRASLEHGATTLWRITTREDGWLIESRKDCPDGRWCGAELSWDGRSGTHPQASVEFNDPINWKIEQLKVPRWTTEKKTEQQGLSQTKCEDTSDLVVIVTGALSAMFAVLIIVLLMCVCFYRRLHRMYTTRRSDVEHYSLGGGQMVAYHDDKYQTISSTTTQGRDM